MENAALMEWDDPTVAAQRRRMRLTVVVSLCAHLLVVVAAQFAPAPAPPRAMPPAITVDLLAALPASAAVPKLAPKPAAKPAPKPAPAPPPVQKVKILPKQAPSAEAVPRKELKPAPAPERIVRPEKAKPVQYEDALAQLREQLGEEAPPSEEEIELARAEEQAFDELLAETRQRSQGIRVDPIVAKWHMNVKRHLRDKWITPPEFRQAGLMTELEVQIAADGRVLGVPEVIRSSGNPHYDDNTVRAVMSASPLPAPPSPGKRTIIFTPEE